MRSIVSRVRRIAAHRYEFTSNWELPGTPAAAFDILKDLWSYPQWWPEFRRAERVADEHGVFALRSVLPLTLHFDLHREIEDEDRLVLRARATGDITGTVEWTLDQSEPCLTKAHFTQDVTLEHHLATRVDFALRPLFGWNHAAAMRSGHRGLLALLDAR